MVFDVMESCIGKELLVWPCWMVNNVEVQGIRDCNLSSRYGILLLEDYTDFCFKLSLGYHLTLF